MAALLILRLEGVLQSWGERARWDTRDTSFIPTKSGVFGLIACAMGVPRGDKRIMQLESNIRMGVRVDMSGLWMEDYHTVMGDILNAEGKKRKDPIISPRRYLQDASFLVVLEGELCILEECAKALCNPVWQVFLGRKSCVPTIPVFEQFSNEFGSLEDALALWPITDKANIKCGNLIGEIEINASITKEHDKLKLLKKHIRRDLTMGNPARNYYTRDVWTFYVPIPIGGEVVVPVKN